ncbi:MAG: response regulator [Candidatus Spechtbacterales bacterium]|nr:response regulator [Candidatus Spechtbacterales bacterium]
MAAAADLTILVVEDDETLSLLLGDRLEAEGFNVLRANDGEQGLEMALANKPNLILLDIVMPNMNGITVLEKLRQDPEGKDLPVIMLTNLGNDIEKVSQATELGVQEYLVKSNMNLDEVVERVKSKLAVDA